MSARILVVGGGLGGVATAVALKQAGLDPILLEKRSAFGVVGSGLFVAANGTRALQRLGVGDSVAAAGAEIESSRFLTGRGSELARWPTGEQSRALDAVTVGIRRPALHGILIDALDCEVLFDSEVVAFEQRASEVVVRTKAGGEIAGDALVGADGADSVIRRQLHGVDGRRYAGYGGWRALVPDGDRFVPAGDFRVYWGRGARVVTYHVGDGYAYWLLMANAEAGAAAETATRDDALRRTESFPEEVRALVAATSDDAVLGSDMVDLDFDRRWGEGRVTLLGDAAHAMTPNLGQGACQAFEDAVVVATRLAATPDVVAALRAYEDDRMLRAKRLLRESRSIGDLGRWKNPLLCGLRDAVLLRVGLSLVGPRKQARDFGARF